MSFDAHANFVYSTVAGTTSANGLNPGTAGVSITLQSGDGAHCPTAPFNLTLWPAGVQPLIANAEIVRVTARSSDTLTVTRTQESSTNQNILAGYQVSLSITVKIVTDIENDLLLRQYGLIPTAVKGFSASPYAAAAQDLVPCDTTSGNVVVTLPTAPADRTLIEVKHVIQGGSNIVTINCGGSDVINKASGVTTASLVTAAESYLLQYRSSGAIWYILAHDAPRSAAYFDALTSLSPSSFTALQTQAALQAAQIAAREAASEGYAVNSGGALAPNASALTAVSTTIASSLFNKANSFVANDTVVFTGIATTTGVSNGTVYYISATSLSGTQFRVSATAGGSAITLGGTTDAAITVTQVGKLNIASGFDLFNGVQTAVSAATAISTTVASLADATNPRWIAVELSDGVTVHFNSGAAAATPAFPTPTASRVVHGWMYIPAGATQIDQLLTTVNGNAKLIDARVIQGSIYALLTGRSGGQTVTGDTASGGNLTLSSTAHATKGKILFGTSAYDEVNNRLGIGVSTPGYPLDQVHQPTANSGTFRAQNITALLDASSATTTSATYTGAVYTISTGNTATAFTGSLTGAQYFVNHVPSGSTINIAGLTGSISQALLGAVGSSLAPTATSVEAGVFQAVNRSNASGTVISQDLSGVVSTVQQVGQGTIALSRGFTAVLTHLAGVATAGTTTLLLGYDLAFSFFSAGTVTTAIGMRLQAWPGGPTYTNGPYGISIEGSTSLNWLQGKTQVGGGSRPTTIPALLYVAGDTQLGTAGTDKLGFFGTTPIVRGTAFTQTYSTASHTHANVTASNPPAGGTGATAGAYDTSAHRDAMITSLTNTIADVANVKQVLNGLIDDLQALGLVG